MLAISLGSLLWPNEWLWYSGDVIKAVGGHAGKQRIHVVLTLSANVLAKNHHTFV
jgi:hypothetical protein